MERLPSPGHPWQRRPRCFIRDDGLLQALLFQLPICAQKKRLPPPLSSGQSTILPQNALLSYHASRRDLTYAQAVSCISVGIRLARN